MNLSSTNKQRNSSLMSREGEQIIQDIQSGPENENGKKSVEDILNGTQEAIGNSINQAISFTNLNVLQASPIPVRRSPSPTSSPRGSPKTSAKKEQPQQQQQQQQTLTAKCESQLSLFPTIEKIETPAEDSISKSSDSSQQTSGEASKISSQDSEKPKSASKVSERAKKKSWYSVLYPSYKSRSEDFKKLFKDVPDDERLVVDYSCALQRDILVHGRLYVSQNYLCFYANIFRWETCLSIKWKEVTSITKEKTARVIPNAISVSAGNDKHFFTSFTTRDKAFLMLFRVWQNALMDKPMQPQEMWQWVHNCYGDELGLTSDDEDYIDPTLASGEDKNSNEDNLLRNKTESQSEDQQSANDMLVDILTTLDNKPVGSNQSIKNTDSKIPEGKRKIAKNNRQRDECLNKNTEILPTDMSDSSDSDESKNIPFITTAECTSMHEGRQLVHTILPINIDNLFNMLFSKSKFLVDFHDARKSTDMIHREWTVNDEGIKTRTVNVTVALTQAVGPKSSHVTETQVMRECSKPGELYSIDVTSVNAGIPYGDSFYVCMHYCLVKTVDDHTMLSVHAQIKYKKSIWGVVKGFIEKNTWAGLEDFYNALLHALQSEYCIPPAKAKARRTRRGTAIQQRPTEDAVVCSIIPDSSKKSLPSPMQMFTETSNKYKWISWFVITLLSALIVLNVILLFKLWKLEAKGVETHRFPNLSLLKDLPKNHKDWIELLKQQEALHETEMRKWQKVLQTAIELLRKVSVVCKQIVGNVNIDENLEEVHNEL